ncbi:MAG: tetratricopeptide repeat protein [Fuerstiella sp.]|nr:tetratricopeptide repeat protein [Fuerstiella sp.]MCP4854287.1 tetratricopeptide repeat protein [Fuerstiella sp.]
MPKNRKLLFRCAAVLLGFAVLPLLEMTCRIGGWGADQPTNDAFAEFAAIRPLFRMDDSGQHYRVAEDRRSFFAEDSFAVQKPSNEYRIFVFGGSTVQGRPYSVPTAFGTFLEIGLKHAAPSKRCEVINCGGVSYASYRLLPIMQECLNYQPDLYIVCTGHNEFLECITYAEVISAAPIVSETYRQLHGWNSFRLLQNAMGGAAASDARSSRRSGDSVLAEEVDALLDHQGGLEAYSRAALHADQVVESFGHNLQRAIDMSGNAGVPLLFMCPPSNLQNCPPFKSEFSAQTDDDTRRQIAIDLRTAGQLQTTDRQAAIALLKQITAVDDRFAFSWYQLGQACMLDGRIDDAVAAFQRARDEDICPLRMTSGLHDMMVSVAEDNAVPLLDIHQLLQQTDRRNVVGDSVLIDHIHPSFTSNQKIAFSMIDRLQSLNVIAVKPNGWQSSAQAAFDGHLHSLDDLYFLHGQRTLKSLEAWAQGRGDGPPLSRFDKDSTGTAK